MPLFMGASPWGARRRRRSAQPFTAALLLLVWVAAPAAAEVRWHSGARSAPARMSSGELRRAITVLAARPEQRRIVAHFDGPLDLSRRAALADSGVRLLSYLGGYAYFAALSDEVDAATASGVAGFAAVEPIDPLNKLHPDLAQGIVRPWSIVSPPGSAAAQQAPGGPTIAVNVLFHRDADLRREAPRVIGRNGGLIRSYIPAVHGVVAHLASGRAAGLAAEDAVMYVEPPLPALSELNAGNRARVGADALQALPYGLDGAGVDVLVYDAGDVYPHDDLAGRLVLGDTAGISDHATHVACTVAGDGNDSSGTFRGMAPGASIVSYGFEQSGGLQYGFLYLDAGDLEADYTEAITVHGADLANNSIGTNTASNGFPCEWEGNYGVASALIDEITRGSTGAPFRIIWANGNERGAGYCGVAYHTTAPPSCAKNQISVGALNSNDDSITSFTSWGPCDDGRLKPDVSAPGCQSGGDNGVTSCSGGGGYSGKCGTSMASPTVAGVAALLLEQYRRSFPGRPDFSNATLKAILAQTAADIANPGPDYQTGYGSVRAVPAAELIAAERFLEAQVSTGEIYSFYVQVGPQDTELKVTLAWDDPAGAPDVDPVLVNDLDLRVLDATGTVYYPWTLDPGLPHVPAVRTSRDGVNNIEQVVVLAPAPGAYKVVIEGQNVAEGPTQSFGVAASPTLIGCKPAATLAADAVRVSCGALLGLRLNDCDLNTDEGLIEIATVSASSASEPGGETILLTENEPFSALFVGAAQLGASDAQGVLHVADGETVTVTYVDADDGAGGTDVPRSRQVEVDCRTPSVTGVEVTEVLGHRAKLTITADEPVRLTLGYGTACGSPSATTDSPELLTAHPIELGGLTDDTTYFFTIGFEDEAGNAGLADNGGACFSFTTPHVIDHFTESFVFGIDLEGRSLTFIPDGSLDDYAVCSEPLAGGLPTNPAGGFDLDLGDDQAAPISLGAGKHVRLYGQSYSTVFVGPNGYLTFGEGDHTYEETLTAHFALPRVAALFDDLHPGAGGAVSWRQFDDRIAVTWDAVPEWGTLDSNTFQIEMFFDGRIRMSWEAVDTADAIVGLSAGTGLDFGFVPSDLSASPTCGPRPPLVFDLSAPTTIGDPVTVALFASDDGLPAPPALTYRIVALPAFGTLTDLAGGGSILAPPYDLAGNAVTYRPYPGYQGADSFGYRVDDGGVAPTGGESLLATVVVQITVDGPETVFQFLTNDADPGFSVTGDWAFGEPTGGGSHNHDPAAAASGRNIYGYNLGGDYTNDLGQEHLTSLPLDLHNVDGAVLAFRRWLGVEASTRDHAAVQLSTDGTTWTTIWNHMGPPISESAWSLQSYDVAALADGRPAVSFRWVMGQTDSAVTYPGWNIDDVRILGVIVSTCFKAPNEVADLQWSSDRQTLVWSAGLGFGDPPVYDTIRSAAPADFTTATVCVESDGADTAATDAALPQPGAAFYYLVRAENDCGPGPLGAGRSGPSCIP